MDAVPLEKSGKSGGAQAERDSVARGVPRGIWYRKDIQ